MILFTEPCVLGISKKIKKIHCISPVEGQSVQCQFGNKDEDSSLNDVNSYYTPSQKYRQIEKVYSIKLFSVLRPNFMLPQKWLHWEPGGSH